jgi:hypothetical protein
MSQPTPHYRECAVCEDYAHDEDKSYDFAGIYNCACLAALTNKTKTKKSGFEDDKIYLLNPYLFLAHFLAPTVQRKNKEKVSATGKSNNDDQQKTVEALTISYTHLSVISHRCPTLNASGTWGCIILTFVHLQWWLKPFLHYRGP